jgi:hypothetical protein
MQWSRDGLNCIGLALALDGTDYECCQHEDETSCQTKLRYCICIHTHTYMRMKDRKRNREREIVFEDVHEATSSLLVL